MSCAPSKDSDQPMPSLIRDFPVRFMSSQGTALSSYGQRRFWSDCADAQADLSLRSSHRSLRRFWHAATQMCIKRTASSEFGTYRLCEQRRFRRACAFAQSRKNLRCSLIQAVSPAKPSDRKPDPWPLWMAGHAQLKYVMTECSKTQIRLTGLKRQRCRIFQSATEIELHV